MNFNLELLVNTYCSSTCEIVIYIPMIILSHEYKMFPA